MQSRHSNKDTAWECAEKSRDYAQSIIKISTTQKVVKHQLTQEEFEQLDKIVDKILAEKISSPLIKDQALNTYESIIAVTKKYATGNCEEIAKHAFDFAYHNYPDIRAEIFKIDGCNHTFLVLNRIKDSHPNDPDTWGNAVICDAWALDRKDQIYKANNYRLHLKNFYLDESTRICIEPFKTSQHTMAPIPGLNSDYFHKVRTIENLKGNFLMKAAQLLELLGNHETILMKKCERSKVTNGSSPDVTDIINQINSHSTFINKQALAYSEKEYKDYRAAKSELDSVIAILTKNTKIIFHTSREQVTDLLNKNGLFGNKSAIIHETTNKNEQSSLPSQSASNDLHKTFEASNPLGPKA